MSITVITVADYKTAFPDTALNNIRDQRIQSAINLALEYLDVKTGCEISRRWNIVEPATGYLTTTQKEYIKRAFLVETQYIISNNMDFSQGSDQTSFGSLSTTSTRPKREEVCASALAYLQQAGLYDYLSFSSPTYFGAKGGLLGDSDLDLSKYVTYDVGDTRYVLYTDPTAGNKLKYLYRDSNGNIVYKDNVVTTDTEQTISGNKTFTGTVNVSTPTSDTQVANKAYVDTKGVAQWGSITGTITNQTDLQNQFDTKQQKVIYSETQPTTAEENDIWVNESSVVLYTYLKSITKDTTNKTITILDQDNTATSFPYSFDNEYIKLLGNEAVSGQPYHFGYYYYLTPSANDITVTMKTITLDNNKTITDYNLSVPVATQTTAGLMSAQDKTNLDNATILPTKVNDRFLHTNSTTGDLEWSEVTIPSNYVTTNTPQTITSAKTWSGTNNNTSISAYAISTTDTANNNAVTISPTQIKHTISGSLKTYDLPTDSGTLALTSEIPTKTSELTNDSGFLTSSSLSDYVTTNSTQNITAVKTFTASPIINQITSKYSTTTYTLSVPNQNSTLATVTDLNAYAGLASDNTFTGVNAFSKNIISSTVSALKRDVDTSYLQLLGGSDSSGSRFALYGKSHSDYAGWLALVADNATNENKLYIKPTGTFLFNDYITIKPQDNGTSTVGTTRDDIYATNTTAGSSCWLSNVFFTASESPDGVETHRYSVLITRHSSSNGVIYAFPFSVDDKIYQCRKSGGTWQSWKSISFS